MEKSAFIRKFKNTTITNYFISVKKYIYRCGQSLFCLNQVVNVGFDVGIIAETINYGFSLNQRTIKSEYN